MATVTVVRYKRRKRLGDDKSPMMYLLKPKAGESKIYSIDSLAQEIESIGSLSVEDVSHVMKSFVRAMKKVLVAGNKVKVDGLGIFYTTLTCPGVEQEKDCTVKNITRINLRFKVDNSLRLANDSTATTRGGDNNMMFECIRIRSSLPEETAVTAPMMMVKAMGENLVVVAVEEKLRIRQHKPL